MRVIMSGTVTMACNCCWLQRGRGGRLQVDPCRPYAKSRSPGCPVVPCQQSSLTQVPTQGPVGIARAVARRHPSHGPRPPASARSQAIGQPASLSEALSLAVKRARQPEREPRGQGFQAPPARRTVTDSAGESPLGARRTVPGRRYGASKFGTDRATPS